MKQPTAAQPATGTDHDGLSFPEVKVLQVHTRYRQPGGEDRVVEAEADLLRAAGHEVLQFRVENPAQPLAAASALASSAWNPRALRRIEQLAKATRPDVAHVHNTWYALSAAVLHGLQRAGIPVVMTLHNYRLMCVNALLLRDGQPCELCVGANPWPGVRYRCYRGSLPASMAAATAIDIHRRRHTWDRDVDLFLALTEFAKGRFVAGGLLAERIRVKPNFVTDPGPRSQPPSLSGMLLFVGRLSPEKGIDRLLEVWQKAVPSPFELVVVGDGPLRGELEATAPTGVRFTGPLDQKAVRRMMGEARALVFPSVWYEVQPLVVLEALASGLPVLGSDLGAIRELLTDLGPGWTVPISAAGWAEALRGLEDDGRVDAAGVKARASYEAHFSPQIGLVNLTEAYRVALS